MLVRDWMTPEVITIGIEEPLQRALETMEKRKIRCLPALEGTKLVGMLTEHDVRRGMAAAGADSAGPGPEAYLQETRVEKAMTRNPVTLVPDFTVEEAAETLIKRNIPAVPVVDDRGGLIGIITQRDLLRATVSAGGVAMRGVLFAFMLEDRPGSIKEVTDVIRRYGGRLVSILTTYERIPEGFRKVHVRAFDLDAEDLPALLKDLQTRAQMLYMVDHISGIRRKFTAFQ
jgi:acetoin utilization protein AcuB